MPNIHRYQNCDINSIYIYQVYTQYIYMYIPNIYTYMYIPFIYIYNAAIVITMSNISTSITIDKV